MKMISGILRQNSEVERKKGNPMWKNLMVRAIIPKSITTDWPENYPVNYHTHTAYCRHAGGTAEEDYARGSLQKGAGNAGFSDHLPFPGSPSAP